MASPPVSPSLTRTTSAADSTGNLTPTTVWTSDQEARLTYCQDQLKQAQKKWSDRQELWIREVEHLLELKRAHKKTQKKQKARAEKALRKAKTWKPLSRTQSNIMDTTLSAPGTTLDDGDDDDDDDSLDGVERSDSMPQEVLRTFPSSHRIPPPLPMDPADLAFEKLSMSSSSSPTSPAQTTGRNPFKKIIRRMSSASVRGIGRGQLGGGS